MGNDENQYPVVLQAEPITAVEAIQRADFDVQVATAKKFPLHSDAAGLKRFEARAIQMATMSEDVAAACLYSLPRGGKNIQGPSVRLAEIVACAYGNIRASARIVEIGETEVIAQGIAHDLESNSAQNSEVRRRIVGKKGRYNDDMIAVTCNAACSIASRNAIFKVVPAALTEPIYQAARQKAIGGIETLDVRRAKMLEKFGLMGISEKRVLDKIKRAGIAQITLEDIGLLIGFYNSITHKEATPEDVFPEPVSAEFTVEPEPEPLKALQAAAKAKKWAIEDLEAMISDVGITKTAEELGVDLEEGGDSDE